MLILEMNPCSKLRFKVSAEATGVQSNPAHFTKHREAQTLQRRNQKLRLLSTKETRGDWLMWKKICMLPVDKQNHSLCTE